MSYGITFTIGASWASLQPKQGYYIIQGSWKNCDSAEKLVDGLKAYKTVFEKRTPEKIIWDEADFHYSIPTKLQDWILDFLDIPACKLGIYYRVAHILGSDLYATLSLIDMYTEGTHFYVSFLYKRKSRLQLGGLQIDQTDTG